MSEAIAAREPQDNLENLSQRETQVLAMASTGLTNAQMAARLDVTVHAVKFHLASIYRKLGVGNRTEAAAVYLRRDSSPTTLEGRAQ